MEISNKLIQSNKKYLIENVYRIYIKYQHTAWTNREWSNEMMNYARMVDAELETLKNEVQDKINVNACTTQSNVWDNHGKSKKCGIGFLDAMIDTISIKSTAGLGYNTNAGNTVNKILKKEFGWFASILGSNNTPPNVLMKNSLIRFGYLSE